MSIISQEKEMGQMIPPWYFGLTYRDFYREVEIYHIIPINYIVSFGMSIKYLWDKFRSRETWIDRLAEAKMHEYNKTLVELINKKKLEEHDGS